MVITEERTIELKLISATDLKKVKKFGREQKCYVVAYIYPSQKQTSTTDNYGGVNPIWNASLTLTCFESDLHPTPGRSSSLLTLDVYCHSAGILHSGGDRLVGSVSLPLADVRDAPMADGIVAALDVRLPSGETQGTLNLSVKLGAKRTLGEFEDPSAARLGAYSSDKVSPSSMDPPGKYTASSSNPGQASSNDYPSSSKYMTSGPNPGNASSSDYPPSNKYMPSGSNPGNTSRDYLPSSQSSASPTTLDKDDTVTGYPVSAYAFAPLGQMPMQNQQPYSPYDNVPMQGQQQNMLTNSGHGPYAYYTEELRYPLGRRERKAARRANKRAGREGRGGGRGKRKGPLLIQGVTLLAGTIMGLVRHGVNTVV